MARRIALFCLCLGSVVTWPLFAQDAPLVRDHPGIWRLDAPNIGTQLTPADVTAFKAAAAAIAAVVHRAPSLATPKGYDVFQHTYARIGRIDSGSARPLQVVGDVEFDLSAYEHGPGGVAANDRDAAATIRIDVNDLSMVTGGTVHDGYVDFADDQGDFVKGNRDPDDTAHGFPVYEAGSDRWVLIRGRDVPVLSHVSRERYVNFRLRRIQAQVDHAQANLATLPKDNAMLAGPIAEVQQLLTAGHAQIDGLHRQLASMTPAERGAPAYVTADDPMTTPEFSSSPDGADPIWTLNPALLDAARARGDAQVLAVAIRGDDDHWPGLAEKIGDEIDWPALAKIAKGENK